MIYALEFQDYPRSDFEVIVISDGSSDGTNDYLSKINTPFLFRSFVQANSGAAVARNMGAQLAKGNLILFLDDDIVPDKNIIKIHADTHSKIGSKDIVLGPMVTPLDWKMSPWVAWEQAMLEKYYSAMIRGEYEPTSRQFFTGNASLKRDFFFQNDCFDPRFRRAEDVEFAYRAEKLGANFIFNPEARGYHYAERSFESWTKTAYMYGMNDVVFTYEKGIDWLLPQIIKEYKHRNFLFKWILPFALDNPKRQMLLSRELKKVGVAFYRLNFFQISRVVF